MKWTCSTSLSADEWDSGDSSSDYESAISAAGYGRFHYWFLFVCGWANASDAVEVLCVSFLLPAAECDLELSSSDKGWLSAIVFIGEHWLYVLSNTNTGSCIF